MIPREQVHPQAVQMLVEYMVDEIRRSESERRALEERWIYYHKVYRALADQDVKTFPFYGAANLVIPVVATDIDVVYAQLMGILFAPDNLLSTRAKQPEMVEFAPRLQEMLQALQFTELNLYNATADFVMETIKLGTGILKTRYRREQKTVYEFREMGGQVMENHRRILIQDHPEVSHVSLFDFFVPATALDIKSSPWVAERVLLTFQQYLNRVREGIYLPSPRLESFQATAPGSHVLHQMQVLDSYVPGRQNKLEFHECWLPNFDVRGDGDPRAILATIHIPTWSLVRLDWNPSISQESPYDYARFLRQEKRFYGIGMCEMLAPFQDEVTAMHNQRIDSGTLANSVIYKARTGVVNEDEPIYPGRWLILDDLASVEVMNMNSGKLDSSVQYEPMTMQYAKARSGVNEQISGQFAPSIGYATAHTNIQQLQQATQRFDQTLRELRGAIGGAGIKAVELYQQFDRPGKAYQVLGAKDGALLSQFLSMPIESIRDGVAIEVTATSASLNKDLEIRTNSILMEQIANFYGQTIQALMMVYNPQVPDTLKMIVMQMIQGGSILLRRTLDAYGLQDTDDIVPRIQEMIRADPNLGQLVGQTGNPLGPQGINAGPQSPMLLGSGGQSPGGFGGGVGRGF